MPLAVDVGAVISSAAVYGMIAPPVNIPVMIIGGGIDLPYIGFDLVRRCHHDPPGHPHDALDRLPARRPRPSWRRSSSENARTWRERVPRRAAHRSSTRLLVVVVVLMIGPKAFPQWFPDPRLPLTFLIGTVAGPRDRATVRHRALKAARAGVSEILPVVGILFGVGMLIEMLTLTGLRGAIVVGTLSLPAASSCSPASP